MEDFVQRRERDPPRWLTAAMALALIAAAVWLLWMVASWESAGRVIGRPEGSQGWLIEDQEEITGDPQISNVLGRQVSLNGVAAGEVIGDYTFFIGREERVPVVLEGELMGRQREEETQVCRGDLLRIHGMVREMFEPEEITASWSLEEDERANLKARPVYVSANRVEVLERSGSGECRPGDSSQAALSGAGR